MLKLDFSDAFKEDRRHHGLRAECPVCHKFHPVERFTGLRSVGICCYICDWFLSGLRREVWTIHSKKYGAPK